MSKKKKNSTKQIKELIIIQTAMFYLTLFLEQAGVIKDNKFVENATEFEEKDITGAISLGKQMMFILSKVNMNYQQMVLNETQKVFDKCENKVDFNYLVFVLTLLMQYKEQFKNKTYFIPTSYDELNDIFDEYFTLGLEDKEQMEVIKDSTKVADEFFEEIMKYEKAKDSIKGNR